MDHQRLDSYLSHNATRRGFHQNYRAVKIREYRLSFMAYGGVRIRNDLESMLWTPVLGLVILKYAYMDTWYATGGKTWYVGQGPLWYER